MKNRLRFLLIMCLLTVLGLNTPSLAQSPQTIEVGPHIGVTSYVGDLNVWRHLSQWDWKQLNQFNYDLGGVVRFNYDSRWSFRLDYTYLHARACDSVTAWRPQGKLNFKTTAHDLSLLVEFNFMDYYTGKNDKNFSPYIFGGVSGFMYWVQPYTGDETLDAMYFNGLGDERYDLFTASTQRANLNMSLSVPFGLGCKVSLSEHLAATAEWRMHYTFTDYFDGVSGDYPAAAQHAVANDSQGNSYDFTDPTGTFLQGDQRGNARNNDWFGMVNLSLTWKFIIPDKAGCKLTDKH